jgi:PBP1b-binding outer membrane lipoprotein LpoB
MSRTKNFNRWFPVSRQRCRAIFGLLTVILAVSGCAGPALNPDMRNTFLDSHDLVVMTDKMASSIAADPMIAQLANRHPMIIVLTALKNKTDEIIPRAEGDIFLHRVRALLTAHESLRHQFVFVLNKATYQRLAEQEQAGAADLGPRADRVQPGYALQATFYSDTKVAPAYRSDYYLCTFYLTNIHTGQIIWEGSYETKKAIHSGFMD